MASEVNRQERPTIDPTKNVLDLVDAAVKRLDDLREAEARRMNEVIALRAYYTKKLAEAESNRINAIRSVDVHSIAISSKETSAKMSAMEKEITNSAESLRALISSSNDLLTERLAAVEKWQYSVLGARQGMGLSWSLIVTGAGLLLAVVGIVAFFNA